MYKQFLISLSLVSITYCGTVPEITKCKTSDSKCITDSGNAFLKKMALGIPEYGVNSVEPVFVKLVDLSSPNLKLIITNTTITGAQNSVLQNIKIDKNKSTLTIKIRFSIQLEGNYEIKGNLLFLPLEGKGPLHVTVRKMDAVLNLNFKEVVGKDGKTHWQVTYRDYTYSLKDKSDVIFENLLDGNELLAGAAKEVIASSGNEIIEEVGTPLITDVAKAVVKQINQLFEALPASELALD